MTPHCLHCPCIFVRYRGCCYRCYQRLLKRVQSKLTTWPELEASGQSLPAKKPTIFSNSRLGPKPRKEPTS